MDDTNGQVEGQGSRPVVRPRHLKERVPGNDTEWKARCEWLKARAGLELPSLPKDTEAKGAGYSYLSLAELLSLLDKPLRAEGIQRPVDDVESDEGRRWACGAACRMRVAGTNVPRSSGHPRS